MDVAAAAINFESLATGRESLRHCAAKSPFGITKPPNGSAAPERLLPANTGGNTEPSEIASIGSSGCVSIHRPIQPEFIFFAGDAVCHLAIDEKWERSGFG